MNKYLKINLLFLSLIILCCACDSRRNQILTNILISPTMTETAAPPTETPTPVPTREPTPTPTPRVEAENLDLLLFGDYDLAEHNIRLRIADAEDPVTILQSQTNLLELSYLKADYQSCIGLLDDINETAALAAQAPDMVLSKAYYIHAQCADEDNRPNTAIDSLKKYLEYAPGSPIRSEVYRQIAYAYRDLEDYEMFRDYINRSISDDAESGNEYILLDYAVSYSLEGNNDEAIRKLTELYDNSADENIKAACNYYLGTVYEAMELKDQVIARYQDSVNNFPKSYYSYLSLLWLIENNQTVSDYQRGLVNYYKGQYSLANDAFRRYVRSEPGNDGSSWYFIGICQMYIGDHENAEASFTKLINDYPGNRYYVAAWDELAYVQWFYLEKYKKAAETLTNYVSRHPDQADSAAFLFEAGRILERGNYLTDAAKTWARMIDEYPLYENSKTALFLAAIASYRSSDFETALAYLNRLLIVSGIPEDQAQTNFWIAKIYQKKNDSYNTQKYFERAAEQTKPDIIPSARRRSWKGKPISADPHNMISILTCGLKGRSRING